MKTNINNIMDTVDEILKAYYLIDKTLGNIEERLEDLELSKPCDCTVDINLNKVNNLIWEIQQLLQRKK